MKPRIFISAVSSKLGQARQLVANVLTRLGYEPVWQDIFGTEPGDLRQMLRDKIDGCDGLIQLVGEAYGFEPQQSAPDFGRVSYTQFEFLHERQSKPQNRTWLIFAEDGCTRDRPIEQAEHRALQEAYRAGLLGNGHPWHKAASDDQLKLRVWRSVSSWRRPIRATPRSSLIWWSVITELPRSSRRRSSTSRRWSRLAAG